MYADGSAGTPAEGSARLFNVKMRASRGGAHVSGAERLVPASRAAKTAAALAERAMSRTACDPSAVHIKIEPAESALRIPAVPVSEFRAKSHAEARAFARRLLEDAGIARTDGILEMFSGLRGMRGAVLLDVDSLERLEPDRARGVRVTALDSSPSMPPCAGLGKDHFSEAVVLASKVLAAPGVVGEICVSDDPGYNTGYVSLKGRGYCRISNLKDPAAAGGGRIFLFRGSRAEAQETIRWLETRPVVVENVPPRPGAAAQNRMEGIEAELREIERRGLYRRCRLLECEAGPHTVCGGRELAVFSSNDYLDLARDPRVKQAAADAALRWGAGTGGSRLVTGTLPPHEELEKRIAAFKGSESAIVYATGYMANVGAIQTLVSHGDAVFSDALNHASIIDGCRLSGAEVFVYGHRDLDDLGRKLSLARMFRRRLVVTDGIFSMDGDAADVPALEEMCARHDAFLMVDEAHATGVAGKTGHGLCEHFGCPPPDIVTGTFSKALGSEGGFVCTSSALAEYMRNKSRPFIFSTSPSPAQVAASAAALAVLESEPWRVARLRENTALFASLLPGTVPERIDGAIVPVVVGDERRAVEASERLLEKGFLVPAIRHPTVPRGLARLRVALSSSHREDEIRSLAAAVRELVRQDAPSAYLV